MLTENTKQNTKDMLERGSAVIIKSSARSSSIPGLSRDTQVFLFDMLIHFTVGFAATAPTANSGKDDEARGPFQHLPKCLYPLVAYLTSFRLTFDIYLADR